jgi:hypothetical protein
MDRSGRALGRWRSAGWALAALALVLRLVIPPGFMPVRERDALAIVICTGHGLLVLDDRHGPKPDGRRTADTPCVFAGSAPPLPPLNAVAIAGPSRTAFIVAPVPDRPDRAGPDRQAGRPHQPRAPPAIPA